LDEIQDVVLPLYNHYGDRIGTIKLPQAIQDHGVTLELRARGTGHRRRFTSAKLYARTSQHWEPAGSGFFTVLQLIQGVQGGRCG
jgi:hypothetical protein